MKVFISSAISGYEADRDAVAAATTVLDTRRLAPSGSPRLQAHRNQWVSRRGYEARLTRDLHEHALALSTGAVDVLERARHRRHGPWRGADRGRDDSALDLLAGEGYGGLPNP